MLLNLSGLTISNLGLAIIFAVAFVSLVAVTYAIFIWRIRRLRPLDYFGFAQSRYTQVDEFKVHYVQEGRGPDLLLVHGIGSSIYCWRLVFAALARHYRVTAIDLPGFGLSDKPVRASYTLEDQANRLRKFCDQVGIKKTYVIAHSMGGAIVAWLTKHHPDRVIKVLFVSPALDHRVVWLDPKKIWWLIHLAKNFLATPALVRYIYQNRILGQPTKANIDEVIAQYYRPYHKSPEAVIVFAKSANHLRDQRLPQGISPLPRPVRIIAGRRDRVVKTKYLKEFLALNPEATLYEDPIVGHQIMEENPEVLIEQAKNFLR